MDVSGIVLIMRTFLSLVNNGHSNSAYANQLIGFIYDFDFPHNSRGGRGDSCADNPVPGVRRAGKSTFEAGAVDVPDLALRVRHWRDRLFHALQALPTGLTNGYT